MFLALRSMFWFMPLGRLALLPQGELCMALRIPEVRTVAADRFQSIPQETIIEAWQDLRG